MTVESSFGEMSGLQDIADGRIEIPLDRKKLQGFGYNLLPGFDAFGSHNCLIDKKQNGWYIFTKAKKNCQEEIKETFEKGSILVKIK